MRIATCVLVTYVLLVVLGAVWMRLGFLAEAKPAAAVMAAAYLGLTARSGVAGAVGGAVVIGYLADLIGGTPVGLTAVVCGVICLIGHLIQRRILVRGLGATLGFAFFVGVSAQLMVVLLRAVFSQPMAPPLRELWFVLLSGVATAVIGPAVLRILRRIDAAFARTHRERDAALEGIAP